MSNYVTQTVTPNLAKHVVITDDKGEKHTFYNFQDLIEYLDSFTMSFLPDGFKYTINEK